MSRKRPIHMKTASMIAAGLVLLLPSCGGGSDGGSGTGGSTSGGSSDVASESVKQKIKDLVGKEDPKRPLSDQKLVQLLKEQNIDIARRTVAKYRESLGILSSSRRKKLF